MRALLFGLSFALCGSLSARAQAEPLSLETVLRTSLDSHPKLAVARLGISEAEGVLQSARGEFDLGLVAEGETAPLGYYDRTYGAIGLIQPTTLYGLEFRAGYRNGSQFPVYEGKKVTSEEGELSIAAILPLLRGGTVDGRRFGLTQAEFGKRVSEEQLKQTRAELLGSAASAYYKWVIVAHKRHVYEDLVRLAADRQIYLEEQVRSGQVAEIELVDNGRLVDSRRLALLELELALKREALNLSFYLRDSGRPSEPRIEDLPGLETRFTEAPKAIPTGDALLDTPYLRVQSFVQKAIREELRLAKNQLLPKLDFGVEATQGLGATRIYGERYSSETETRVSGKLGFALDMQRRKVRGKLISLEAKSKALDQKIMMARELLAQELEALRATWANANARAELARRALEAARVMANAERERLELGQSSILQVNLREEAERNAELSELDALLSYHLARAQYQSALGRSEIRDYLPFAVK